jgi:hypothetical protein
METPLCKLAFKYGTDKCPQIFHTYTPVYYELLKDLNPKKVLELGIGTSYTMRHVTGYLPGASLRMWRDFFPNAHVYGVDISEEAMFEEDRITTFLMDTRSEKDMKRLIETIGSDIDLVVDDGPHDSTSQIATARMLLPLLDKAIYIVEDVKSARRVMRGLADYNPELRRLERTSRDNNLVIIRK